MKSLDERLEDDLVKGGVLDAQRLADIKAELKRAGKNARPSSSSSSAAASSMKSASSPFRPST